jgi:hypothetical protein
VRLTRTICANLGSIFESSEENAKFADCLAEHHSSVWYGQLILSMSGNFHLCPSLKITRIAVQLSLRSLRFLDLQRHRSAVEDGLIRPIGADVERDQLQLLVSRSFLVT